MLKPIPEFPSYFASDDGNVFSLKPERRGNPIPQNPRQLKPFIAQRYRMVILIREKKRIHKKVSACILEAFVGPRPKGMQICHGEKGRLNDSLINLSWKTSVENNSIDKERDGTLVRGSRNGNARLNESIVRKIRIDLSTLSCPIVAEKYGVSKSTVRAIKNNKIWKGKI